MTVAEVRSGITQTVEVTLLQAWGLHEPGAVITVDPVVAELLLSRKAARRTATRANKKTAGAKGTT